MNIGLVARMDYTGLGMQTLAFYQHMTPAKTLVVDLSHLNGQKNDLTRYPDATYAKYTPYPETTAGNRETRLIIDEFLEGLDLVFTCETPYDYHLFSEAHRRGVKTVLQYNFEFLDHVRQPGLPQPDLFAAPSLWNYETVSFPNKCFLPVPVDRHQFAYKPRCCAQTFLHVAGTPAAEDRNGTQALIEAWKFVKSDVCLLIRTQKPVQSSDSRIVVTQGVIEDQADLYDTGDVFVMPRKFGGLCLPVNEAMSCGMPVLMTDVSPQNMWLPFESLVPAVAAKQIMTKSMIDVFEVDRYELAARVERLAGDPDLVAEMSDQSNRLAEQLDWDVMRDQYERTFDAVLDDRIPSSFVWEN